MPDRGIAPDPDSSKPEDVGHYQAEDDIEVPEITESGASRPEEIGWTNDQSGGMSKSFSKGFSSILGAAVLIGAIAVGSWFVMQRSSAEKGHPNWQHVDAAADASEAGTSQLVHLDTAGNSRLLPSIEVSAADLDRSTTRQVRAALQRSDLMAATTALQAAQKLPSASQNPDVTPPQIGVDSELATALSAGRQELFQIELFDCCDEDGDIVEVIVNGSSFATVPIMNGGTMLSIPLQRGNNTVTVRGVKDGGGGVTLSFRTSRGEYFARSMHVGDEYQMGIVVR